MIKAIIFDCFGVLSDVNLWQEFLAGISDTDQIQKARDLNRKCDAGLITREEFFKEINKLTGKVLHDVESLKSSQSIKNIALLEYIKDLKASYKIGLLSNIGSNWIRDEFLSQQEQNLFDAMTMSYEVGFPKPDPRIYENICNKLSVELEEAVFIDDISSYVEAANSLGMKGLQYDNFQQLKHDLNTLLNHS